ncbi:ScbR family autoregulator-binding transcription factor [Streptomyces sp. 21So2-11]|uniref:ScbR family autoregulator-binding transcription factor n=1 Tax=Streptomyces sp. 21So2-11 TaxID=3144408 RepID=UPI003219171B
MTSKIPPRRPRVQRRSQDTRRLILEAAGTVFANEGYAGATLQKIQDEAGIARGTLIHHFRSKEDLRTALLDAQVALVSAPPRECKIQEVVDMAFLFAAGLQNDPLVRGSARLTTDGLAAGLDVNGTVHIWVAHIEGMLTQASEAGQLLPTVTPLEAAEALVGAFIGTQQTSQLFDNRTRLHHRISRMWRLFLPSIVVPGMLASLDFAPDRLARMELPQPSAEPPL